MGTPWSPAARSHGGFGALAGSHEEEEGRRSAKKHPETRPGSGTESSMRLVAADRKQPLHLAVVVSLQLLDQGGIGGRGASLLNRRLQPQALPKSFQNLRISMISASEPSKIISKPEEHQMLQRRR